MGPVAESAGARDPATLWAVDAVLAALLSVGAMVALGAVRDQAPVWLAAASGLAATSAVAWRRRAPAAAALVAVGGLLVYQLATRDQNLAFEPLACVLVFYLLGRRALRRTDRLVAAALVASALGVCAAVAATTNGASVLGGIGAWAVWMAVPAGAGILVARRTTLTAALAHTAARLAREQGARSALAAAEERNRVARELHDVVAHSLSVMVIQASAARLIVHDDASGARRALASVAESGRDAMTDLRRLMGPVRHEDVAANGPVGVTELPRLVKRVRASGLDADLRFEVANRRLPPAVEATAYRVVQEALSNVLKHVGPTRVAVVVTMCDDAVAVEVADAGPAAGTARAPMITSGYGLVGMRERIAIHGGDLHAGPAPGGGWTVVARIPLRATPPRRASDPPEPAAEVPVPAAPVGPWLVPWFDWALAAAALVVFELAVITSPYRPGRSFVEAVVVALIATATMWRRRAPLAFLAVVGVLAVSLSGGPIALHNPQILGGYLVLVPTYAVAAWEPRRRAVLALGVWLAGAVTFNLLSRASVSAMVGGTAMGCAVWLVGRMARNQRRLADQLAHANALLQAELRDRMLLAAAAERARIARELHGLVARGIVSMIVQAESAQTVITTDPAAATAAIPAIEHTGREALVEMRQILGALRAPGRPPDLEPVPLVGQVPSLTPEPATLR
ncbi:MAG TPA: sensor histidine kinase [Acidimicrobiales bacterium]|jgi:signal transduction histidine kinase|nr:sensor histidine kinase [Acidimicrobiales bacterium]